MQKWHFPYQIISSGKCRYHDGGKRMGRESLLDRLLEHRLMTGSFLIETAGKELELCNALP